MPARFTLDVDNAGMIDVGALIDDYAQVEREVVKDWAPCFFEKPPHVTSARRAPVVDVMLKDLAAGQLVLFAQLLWTGARTLELVRLAS